jgi:hypothetical protein
MTTTSEKLATGDHSFAAWLADVSAKFPVADEFRLAEAIYSFAAAFENGMTPAEAYADFDAWVSA